MPGTDERSPFGVFRHLAIEHAEAPPTDVEIAAMEAALGARLPEAFLAFLEVGNGGYLEYVLAVPVGDGQTEALSFCGLYSTHEEDDRESFLAQLHASRRNAQIPEGVLPFARDGGGSEIFLDLSPEGAGRVVAFVRGLPPWTGLRQASSYVEVAASFDEYVSKLRLDREATLDHLEHDVFEIGHVDAIEAYLDVGLPRWRDDDHALVEAVAAARARLALGE